ncbi:MAG: PAS domain-containing sensor histidine kinase, partial [Betaproteobacteria bacterium]
MSPQVVRALILIGLGALVALPVGRFYAAWAGWAVFCAGLILQMAFHFRNFTRLDRWSRAP